MNFQLSSLCIKAVCWKYWVLIVCMCVVDKFSKLLAICALIGATIMLHISSVLFYRLFQIWFDNFSCRESEKKGSETGTDILHEKKKCINITIDQCFLSRKENVV